MRRKFVIFQASPRRLLSLLLIQILIALAYVDGRSGEIDRRIEILTDFDKASGGHVYIKQNQLISRCSQRHLQMLPKRKIDALGPRRSLSTVLNFESVPSVGGQIRIKGDVVKQYLCFSRRGRLIYRTNGESSRCMFKEIPHYAYIKLQSVINPSWYVGFNKRGKRMKGYSINKGRRRKEKCFMFTKIPLDHPWRHRHNADLPLIEVGNR